ncbi:MAG TPA: cyanophycinase [Pirellulales bacterium]|jgi:cyanophycinase
MVRRSSVAILGMCLIGIASAARAEEKKGSLVIIGGALRNTERKDWEREIWETVVDLAGGDSAKIAVFPTASGTPRDSGQRAVATLEKLGAEAFVVPLGMMNVDVDFRKVVVDEDIVEQVRSSTGVFFTGGDQKRITKALRTEDGKNTPLLDAVWEVYNRGGVIAGTSAGAAVLSRVMFSDPDSVLSTLKQGVKFGKEIDDGLGFLDPSWFIEQHCLTRGRFARALVAMHSQGLKFGIGVDENTACVVRNGYEVEIVGYKGAVVLDLSNASHDPDVQGFNLKNVRMTYLDHGDTFNLHTLEVMPAKEKQQGSVAMPQGTELENEPSRTDMFLDILGNTTVFDVLVRLIQSRKVEAIGLAFDGLAARDEPTQGFEFRFYPGADSAGWYGEVPEGTGFTVSNIHLDVRPIEISGPLYK